jgi:chaperonin GroEL (HSP60 family)
MTSQEAFDILMATFRPVQGNGKERLYCAVAVACAALKAQDESKRRIDDAIHALERSMNGKYMSGLCIAIINILRHGMPHNDDPR